MKIAGVQKKRARERERVIEGGGEGAGRAILVDGNYALIAVAITIQREQK